MGCCHNPRRTTTLCARNTTGAVATGSRQKRHVAVRDGKRRRGEFTVMDRIEDRKDLLEQLARACAPRAWRLACALVGRGADAEDVLQKTFVVAATRTDRIPRDD